MNHFVRARPPVRVVALLGLVVALAAHAEPGPASEGASPAAVPATASTSTPASAPTVTGASPVSAAANSMATQVSLLPGERLVPWLGGPIPAGASLVVLEDEAAKSLGKKLLLGGWLVQLGVAVGALIASAVEAVMVAGSPAVLWSWSIAVVPLLVLGAIPILAPVLGALVLGWVASLVGTTLQPAILRFTGALLPVAGAIVLVAVAVVETMGLVLMNRSPTRWLKFAAPPEPARTRLEAVVPERFASGPSAGHGLVLARF